MINPNTTHLLIRHQEIALKGRNRPEFEKRLRTNLERCIGGGRPVENMSGRFVIGIAGLETDLNRLVDRLSMVSGVSAVTPCIVVEPAIETIKQAAIDWARHDLEKDSTTLRFAVRARRADKRFPLTSAEVDVIVGSQIKKLRTGLTVDLGNPELKISIELRQKHALVYSVEKAGVRGVPMDPTQRVVCLLSGGIDSPVAAYEMMRRGCAPVFVHFHSRPFTSEDSVAKVKRLATILRTFSPFPLELWLVPLLEIQKQVRDQCNERYRTIHYRRFMMMIAQELANRRGAKALVTGDAIGQVASQTLTNLATVEHPVTMPVLRPLIATDKDQIIVKAQRLGTYETSIEPHDDSCVLFAPTHPATQARLDSVIEGEEALPKFDLIFAALDSAEKILL